MSSPVPIMSANYFEINNWEIVVSQVIYKITLCLF